MSTPRKGLDTSYVRNKTNTNYSDVLSLNPQVPVFLPGVKVLFISAMNTQWHDFLEIWDQRRSISPAIHFCKQSLLLKFPLPSSHLKRGPSCFPRVPRLESRLLFTGSEGLFSVTIGLCPLKEAICSPWRMWVSLPVKISKLAPVRGLASTPFDSSARVLLVPDLLLGLGRWFHRLSGDPQEVCDQSPDCLDIVPLLSPSAVISLLTSPSWWMSCKSQNVDTVSQLLTVFQRMQRVQ